MKFCLYPAALAVFGAALAAQAQDPLVQAQQMYPATMAAISANCPSPSSLVAQTYASIEGGEYAAFYCWVEFDPAGRRSGQWLGRLPLREGETPFVPPFTCPGSDATCPTLLPQLRATYPTAIAQAELQCAIKDGQLVQLVTTNATVDLRCGFFATTVWDENGDGLVDYEDPVSVDVSVAVLPWPVE
ncbi:MAG: hypothetical protein ACFCVD_01730 [Nodosilinea sp.]